MNIPGLTTVSRTGLVGSDKVNVWVRTLPFNSKLFLWEGDLAKCDLGSVTISQLVKQSLLVVVFRNGN